MSAIHKRIYSALRKEFKLLAKVFAQYLPPEYPYDVVGGQRNVKVTDFDERIDIGKFLPPLPEEMQKLMMQDQVMQQAMGNSTGSAGSASQPPQAAPPQQMNEVANAPENRVNQRLRNNQRTPQGEI